MVLDEFINQEASSKWVLSYLFVEKNPAVIEYTSMNKRSESLFYTSLLRLVKAVE